MTKEQSGCKLNPSESSTTYLLDEKVHMSRTAKKPFQHVFFQKHSTNTGSSFAYYFLCWQTCTFITSLPQRAFNSNTPGLETDERERPWAGPILSFMLLQPTLLSLRNVFVVKIWLIVYIVLSCQWMSF